MQIARDSVHRLSRLRIEYAMQIEGRRGRRGLTQHHMDLRSMVRLMVEQMAACDMRGFHVVFPLVVRIGKRTAPKRGIETAEERLDPEVLARPRGTEVGKVVVENLVERRRHPVAPLE